METMTTIGKSWHKPPVCCFSYLISQSSFRSLATCLNTLTEFKQSKHKTFFWLLANRIVCRDQTILCIILCRRTKTHHSFQTAIHPSSLSYFLSHALSSLACCGFVTFLVRFVMHARCCAMFRLQPPSIAHSETNYSIQNVPIC